MHQLRRSPPTAGSPTRPGSNITRTNHPREQVDTARSGGVASGPDDDTATTTSTGSDDKDPVVQRLNQTIQNLYCKGILVILQDRLELAPAYKKTTNQLRINKWFGLDITESDTLLPAYSIWKSLDISQAQPPTMIIDVLISSRDLKSNEVLVVHDEYGKTTYVEDAVRSYYESLHMEVKPDYDIVLERWQFDLGMFKNDFGTNLVNVLPKMYKNAVVLFRALYALLHLLPTWKLSRKADLSSTTQKSLPNLSYRVYQKSEHPFGKERDGLFIPLPDAHSKDLEEYEFENLDTPAGRFRIKVNYRQACDFRIEASEALISSRINESNLFKPSLRRQSDEFDRDRQDIVPTPAKTSRQILRDVDQAQQAYGSLSTYHLAGYPISSSPLSTLRAARELNAVSSRYSPPNRPLPDHRTSQDSHGSLRSDGMPSNVRRTSVTFMPFKSPSLSASPSPLSGERLGTPRVSGASGNRSSALTALAEARHPGITQQSNQFSSTLPSPVPTPSTVSPRPTPKYSSSFSHRRSRNSISLSKDDDLSSGRASPRPGSGAGEANTSSGSLNADDDNISDFLKMLDSKKDLKSFRSPDASIAETSTRRTTVALSKFSRIRDSNAVLSDSMSSSVLGHRSSISSSRQLSSVPPMIGGASLSTASSPGERMSPRTPHTPAIPSRLSANSIIDYNTHRERTVGNTVRESNEVEMHREISRGQGTGAIDIPNSPRIFQPSYRRSSSVAQQDRALNYGHEDLADVLPFGNRSTSLGGNGQQAPLTLSQMLAMQDESGAGLLAEPMNHQPIESAPMSREVSTTSQDDSGYHAESSARGGSYRLRGIGRGHRGPHGSSTSLTGDRGSASGGSDARGGRQSFQRSSHLDEDELLFAMSDFGVAQQSRTSLEEGRRVESGGQDSVRRGASRRRGAGGTGDAQAWS